MPPVEHRFLSHQRYHNSHHSFYCFCGFFHSVLLTGFATTEAILATMAASAAPSDAAFDSQSHPAPHLYQAIVEDDHGALCKIFAANARNSIVSYMSMKSRWARQQESMAKSGMVLGMRRDTKLGFGIWETIHYLRMWRGKPHFSSAKNDVG